MPLPHEQFQQQVDPHSASGSLLGFGYEFAKYATWRNPWFLQRVGTSGWDPRGRGVMSTLDRWTGGSINKIMAPDVGRFYGTFERAGENIRRAGPLSGRAYLSGLPKGAGVNIEHQSDWVARRASQRVDRTKKAAMRFLGLEGGTDVFDSLMGSRKDVGSPLPRMLGERTKSGMEDAAGAWNKARIKAGTATTGAQVAYGVGKVLRVANAALWLSEAVGLAAGGFKAVAAVGAQTRQIPHSTLGSGVQDNYMAATLRQASLMDMYSSEYGHRRSFGSEAKLLHM